MVIDQYNLLNNLRGNGHGYIRNDGKLDEFQGFYIDHTQVKKLIKPLEATKEATKRDDIKNNNIKSNIVDLKKEGYLK